MAKNHKQIIIVRIRHLINKTNDYLQYYLDRHLCIYKENKLCVESFYIHRLCNINILLKEFSRQAAYNWQKVHCKYKNSER